MSMPHQFRTRIVTAVLAVGGMLLAMVLAARIAEERSLRAEQQQVQRQLRLHAQALQQRIDRYRALPRVLALDAELRDALRQSPDAARRLALNLKLERAAEVTRAATLTLIDRSGVALAASNWREKSSNVGQDYSFRPYVRQAMAQGSGRFYGVGVTTGEPGYFLSQAIEDGAHTAGVVVIKIELAALEREWVAAPDIVLASDEHDVVFLASRPAWRYRTLRPLSEADQLDLRQSRQYGREALAALAIETVRDLGDGGRLARVDLPGVPARVHWQSTELDEGGWRLHLLHDAAAPAAAGRAAAIAAGGAWLSLVFLLLLAQQRRRLTTLRQRSRRELEAVLRQHAEELRTAQDGVLQAARRADAGLSRNLEHLPQGVVIIDAALCLQAWNSRYVELFQYPLELMQVGRPIEDLFRHNARRGLLGPGPAQESIQRRLEHLRSGRPHLRESEKEDGTVLEIRGNPLPDGGFVTSYADITSYKNTARELRSIAEALERRVEERTRALAVAKAEAENANRYKTRFVAAAVHDLLQPLNAARLFLSALRGRLGDTQARAIAENADSALAAQNAILGSLLDIARLEAGSQQTQVRDFPLDPLLQALGNEAGIVARSRGLAFHRIATQVVVRSDEALLRRILQNFLSNALRYTRRGRVLLGCRREGDGVRIELHDQGPGIPESRQKEIFEEFRRLDDGVAHERGAGLGLAIVERIGRLLGHRIGLRSRLGRGSVFSVSVPCGARDLALAAAPPAPGETATESELSGCRIWCVDDDPRVCQAMRLQLERWDCSVELAGGDHDAMQAARPGQAPDLLLLDMQLGDVDGLALYARLCERWGRATPVILVTAERGELRRAQAMERGMGFLTKPVRPPALRALIAQVRLKGSA